MFRVVLLQGIAALFVTLGAFALRLAAAARRPQGTSAATFFVGELLKVASTIALLALVVWAYRDLVWLAMIAAVIVTLKSYFIALIWR
jgi:ATP synthase protein I